MSIDKVKYYNDAYNKIYRDCETKRLKAYNRYKETERRLLEERDRKLKKLLADMVHYSKGS